MTADVPGAARLPHVAAVLVSHEGARWLTPVLDALAAQTRAPDDVIAVDTSSTDGSTDLLTVRLGAGAVLVRPARCGFGEAVAAGVESLRTAEEPASSWIWLLHDDSAPAPDALERLLEQATGDVAIVGPKTREWPSLRRLLEVGVTITGTGSRETGLEPGEPDQGQHDEPRDVLAVNTAGLLVRRDVWHQLGGLDPLLPLFGDDLDLGWRAARAGYRTRVAPDAVVFHLEAASRGLRPIGVSRMRPRALQRRAALVTLLANARPRAFAWQWLRLLLGSLLRALGLLVAKAPREATDELRAVASVYLHPFRLLAARRRRRPTQRVAPEAVRGLLPSPLLPYRHGLDAVARLSVAITGGRRGARPSGRRSVETGPVADEAEDLAGSPGLLARLVTRPYAALLGILVLLALWWARDLFGAGQLQGGSLVPAPDGVGQWWALHTRSWHPVGIGTDLTAAPYVLLLVLAGTVTFAQPWLLVDLLVLAAVPLCACTALLLGRHVLEDVRTRIGWAAGYALLPVATGAVAQGRLGTLVALVVAPLLVSAVVSAVRRGPTATVPWWQHAARIGLWLSVATALAPVSYVLALAGIAVTVLWWPRLRALPALAAGLALPRLLLWSWMRERVDDVEQVWAEAGRPDTGAVALTPGWRELAAGLSGAPGQAPEWTGLVLVAGVLVAVTTRDRRRTLVGAWAVATCALALAVVGAGRRIPVPGQPGDVPVWVGLPGAVWTAGLLMVLALAADGAARRLAGSSFGWRQLVAALTGAVLLAVPALGVVWWASTGDGLLERTESVDLPPYLAEQASGDRQSATLVLAGSTDSQVRWQVVRDDGLRLGEESVLPDGSDVDRFSQVVVDLVTDPRADDASFLLDHGVGAVLAVAPVDATLAAALDSAGGLRRSGTSDPGARAWEIDADAGAARVTPGSATTLDGRALQVTPGLTGELEPDAGGGLLRLGTPASDDWSATAGGAELERVVTASGTQAFAFRDATGIRVTRDDRRWQPWAQLAGLALLVVLALPGRRRAA